MEDQDRTDERYFEYFGGRDPLEEAQDRINTMQEGELKALVLIAANRLGTIMKGNDYDNGLDAMIHLGEALDMIIHAYDSAQMQCDANTDQVGCA